MSHSNNQKIINNHQLIQREQNYLHHRKLLTIHSEDRDVNKWPKPNHFEVILPTSYANVESMRLLDISLPVNFYSFSNSLQNTKLKFSLTFNLAEFKDPSGNEVTIFPEINIDEGFYTPEQLSNELTSKMNRSVQDILVTDISNNYSTQYAAYLASHPSDYSYFIIYFNSANQKYWFGNVYNSFTLLFDAELSYDISNCQNKINAWDQYTKWGLPSYIGFEKEKYISTPSGSPLYVDHVRINTSTTGIPNSIDDASKVSPYIMLKPIDDSHAVYYVKAPSIPKLLGDNCIYLEVNKYNTYDEIYPYSSSTSTSYKNDYGAKTNSAFAKIFVTGIPYSVSFESSNGFLNNMSYFDPPLERLSKLEFKFRYHDGRLVDFQDFPFTFTIEVNMLRNEILKTYNIRSPILY
jgi:hypothetical protein